MTRPIVATAPWVSERQHEAACEAATAVAGHNGFSAGGVGWYPQAFKCCRRAFYYAPLPTDAGVTALWIHDEPKCPACDPIGVALEDDDVPRRDADLVELAQRLVKTSAVHTMLVLLDDAQRQSATDQAPPDGGTVGRLRNPDDVLQIEALRRIKGFDLAIAAQASRGAVALFNSDDCNPANARLDSIERREEGTTVVFYVPHVRGFDSGDRRTLAPVVERSGMLACAFESEHAAIGTIEAVREWSKAPIRMLRELAERFHTRPALEVGVRGHRSSTMLPHWRQRVARFSGMFIDDHDVRVLWVQEGFEGDVDGFVAAISRGR